MLTKARERKARTLEQARDWPATEGFVLRTVQSRDADRSVKVSLNYLYKVHDEEFYGADSFTLTSEADAGRFESRCREQKLRVRYQQDKPEVSVLDPDGMR